VSAQSTEFEKKFSSLLQEGKKDDAKAHLVAAKDDDLKSLTRVAKCRAVVLLQGQADDVKNAAMAPRYLKLTKEQLQESLLEAVGEHKKTGKAAKPKAKKKAKGTLPSPGKGPAKRRGLKPGGGPPPEGDEKPKDEEEVEAAEETPDEEPETAQEAPEEADAPEDTPETPSVDPGATQELLEGIREDVKKVLADVDEKMGEVLINTNAVVKSLSEVKGQEQQSREALQKFEEFNRNFQVLYEQNGFIIESLGMIGAGVMDCSPDEFRQLIIDQIEERAKERAEKMPKSSAKDEETEEEEKGGGSD
jgi:hypothetical protein